MNWFKDLKIGTRLLGAFLLVAAIATAIGVEGYTSLKTIAASDETLYRNNTVPIVLMGDISTFFQRIRVNTRELILAENEAGVDKAAKAIETYRDSIDILSVQFEKLILSDRMREVYNAFLQSRKAYGADLSTLIALVRDHKDQQARALLKGSANETARAEMNAIAALVDLKESDAESRAQANSAESASAGTTMIMLVAGGGVLSVLLGLFISRSISRPVKTLTLAAEKLAVGDIDVTLDATNTKDEIGELSASFKSLVENVRTQVNAADGIANGNLAVDVQPRSDRDVLGKAFVRVLESLRGLVGEADMLSRAAVAGKLATRGNAEKFQGGYKDIVSGVNDTLDAVIGPLNVAAEYVDRIAKGDIPAKITDSYNGDFNEIKNNLNQCIDALSGLISDMNHMSKEHDLGDIDVAMNAEQFAGAYRTMAQGVNHMVSGHITVKKKAMACLAEFGRGNFEAPLDRFPGKKAFINDTIEQMRVNLKALITDAVMLSQAAVDGKLATRADASKHSG